MDFEDALGRGGAVDSFNNSGIIFANSIASVGTEGGGDWASLEVREESVATECAWVITFPDGLKQGSLLGPDRGKPVNRRT